MPKLSGLALQLTGLHTLIWALHWSRCGSESAEKWHRSSNSLLGKRSIYICDYHSVNGKNRGRSASTWHKLDKAEQGRRYRSKRRNFISHEPIRVMRYSMRSYMTLYKILVLRTTLTKFTLCDTQAWLPPWCCCHSPLQLLRLLADCICRG